MGVHSEARHVRGWNGNLETIEFPFLSQGCTLERDRVVEIALASKHDGRARIASLSTQIDVKAPLRRGRPRQLEESERRRRLIDAAEHVFVTRGYGAASMDEIARRAGMSKKTIYRLYAAKEDLFAALIASRRDALAALIENVDDDEAHRPDDVLGRFLRQIARFVLAPRQAALF